MYCVHIDKKKSTHTPDMSYFTTPNLHSIQIVNYSTSYCNIDNIDIEQFAYSDGTEGI